MLDLLGLEIQVFVRCHVSAEIQTKNSQCSQLLSLNLPAPYCCFLKDTRSKHLNRNIKGGLRPLTLWKA